jgi:hypothetical protein
LPLPPSPNGSAALPIVIPSEAEGSAVLRTIRGNVFDCCAADWFNSAAFAYAIRQSLPGWLQGSQDAKMDDVQAVDSKEESDLDGSALTRKLFGPANATVSA